MVNEYEFLLRHLPETSILNPTSRSDLNYSSSSDAFGRAGSNPVLSAKVLLSRRLMLACATHARQNRAALFFGTHNGPVN